MQAEVDGRLAGKPPFRKSLLLPKKRRYTKSTFIKIFTYSIFISLCVLLLTLCILYYSFKSIVTKEIHNQSIHLLVQTQSIFNTLHEWIIPSFRQIKSEPAISALVNSKNLDKIDISAGIDRLIEVLSAYHLVHSIYVYNHQTGQFFSTTNGYEGTSCSDAALPDILHNIRRFGVYRYIARKMTYRIHDNVYRSDFANIDTINAFSIVVADIPDSDSSAMGALIVNIGEQKIAENFFPTQTGSTGRLIIIDREGRILTHPDQARFGTAGTGIPYIRKIMESGQEEGVFADTSEGVRYLVSYTTHPVWGWRFINVMPYEEIFRQLTDFSLIAGVAFVLLMVLSICLAYISSRSIYSPIDTLFQSALNLKGSIREQEPAGAGRRMSELQYVDQVFKGIIKKADRLTDTIERHQEIVRQDVVRGLVLGQLDPEALESYLGYLGTDLDEGPFLIAVMRLDNFQRLSESYPAEEIARFFRVLKELVSHYVPLSRFVLPLRKDHLCVICNLQSSAGQNRFSPPDLKTAFSTIQETIKRQLGITVTIGLSDAFPSRASFHEKYNACLAATQFRFRSGGNAMILTGDIEQAAATEYIFPEDRVRALFNELALGKLARVEQALDEILSSVKERNFEDYGFMVQSIAYQTSKHIEKMEKSLKGSAITLRGLLQPAKSSETLQELKTRLMEIYTLIAEVHQKKQGSRLEELAHKTRAYIERHFQDVSLCTESLADVMGVTAYYIRFAYKKAFECSLSEAINSLRLEYCKDQLLKTRLPAKKIYQAAGFYNYSYFFTLFKKNTGLTPNQFRFQGLGSY